MSNRDSDSISGSEGENDLYQRLLSEQIEKRIDAAIKRRFASNRRVNRQEEMELTENVAIAGPSRFSKGDLIPKFDPDDRSCMVTGWLQKIDQLGTIHAWTEYE